jgi:hypothetical protein
MHGVKVHGSCREPTWPTYLLQVVVVAPASPSADAPHGIERLNLITRNLAMLG